MRIESLKKKKTINIQAVFGHELWEKVAHCKILEWQVVNKKMNNNSMEPYTE